MRAHAWVTAAVLSAALSAPGVAGAQVVVRMDAATQARLGLRTAPLAAARGGLAGGAYARGLDLAPLAALESDLDVARAATAASAAEAARTAALAAADATVSRKVAQAAAAQAQADAARATLLRRRVGLEWGPGLAALPDARRAALVAAAAAGRAALVRVDPVGFGSAVAPREIELDLGAHGRAAAAVLGPARAGDPRAVAPGLLALVSGPAAAWVGVGVALSATLPRSGAAGVLIPRNALIRTAGATFAYVRRADGAFERRPVIGGVPRTDGLFAPSGFRPGEAVVTAGAAMLFAAETAPAKGD